MSQTNSVNSGQDLSVERESVVPLVRPQRAQAIADSPPAAAPQPPPKSDHAFVGVLAALTSLLAARLLLLLSISGAFVLAVMAMQAQSYAQLAVLVSFCCLTVLPMTYLDVVTHRRGGK